MEDEAEADEAETEGRTQSPPKLQRRLTFTDGLCIVVGIIVGSGIFASPGRALRDSLGSPGLVMLSWFFAMLLVLLTSQCYFELQGMFPTAGGDYDYIMRAYGARLAFAFAWFNFFISKPGSQAIIASVFGRYLDSVLTVYLPSFLGLSGGSSSSSSVYDGETPASKVYAVLLIASLTAVNCLGVRESTLAQRVLTLVKAVLVAALLLVSLAYAVHSPATVRANLSPSSSFEALSGRGALDCFFGSGSALVACLWSFDGWADLGFMSEELNSPHQLPSIVLLSVLATGAIYLLINCAYLAVLPVETVIGSRAVAVDLAVTIMAGNYYYSWLPCFFSLGVALSAAGSANGSIMTGGRAFYAVARARDVPGIEALALVSARGAPYNSLLAQGFWCTLLLCAPGSNFSTLLDFFGPVSWVFYSLTSMAVVVLRLRDPHRFRPFRCRLYPLEPLAVVVVSSAVVVSALLKQPAFTIVAFAIVFAAFPAHALLRRCGAAVSEHCGDAEAAAGATRAKTSDLEDQAEPAGLQLGRAAYNPLTSKDADEDPFDR